MAKTPTYTYIAGLDIGNGYTKGLISAGVDDPKPDEVDIPSAVAIETLANALPIPDAEAKQTVTNKDTSLYDMLDVTFDSPLINTRYRYLFGKRSLSANARLKEFTIDGGVSKADQDLSKILVLGLLAGRAVKDYITEHKHVPNPANDDDPSVLKVRANVALALPINEYRHHRAAYATAFTGPQGQKITHTVTVRNFETPIVVQVIVNRVDVIAEGASAQYAITAYGKPLAQRLLDDARATQGIALDGVTAGTIVGITDSIGVDIGEGTVNFPVFTDGKFNQDASYNFGLGYGSILERSLRTMNNGGVHTNFDSRKKLADYLLRGPVPLKEAEYQGVLDYVEDQVDFFVDELAEQFGRVLRGAQLTQAVYVYGGGSGPIRDKAYPALAKKVKEIAPQGEMPVFYLDTAYSRKLNREGLMIAASAGARRG